MKSISKIIAILLLGVLALLVVAAIAITQLFDPNDYKDEIRQLVREQAQLELNLDGEISWSLFPWLGLEVKDVQIARLDTVQQPFAKLRALGLSVRVMPLLRKEIQMSAVRIDGLNLELNVDANGVSNWQAQDVVAEEKSTDAKPPVAKQAAIEQSQQEAADSGASALKLDVNSLIVNSARLNFKDEQSGQQFTLENLQITTGRISEGEDISIKLSGFLAANQPELRARVELTTQAYFDLQQQKFAVKELRMAGEVTGEPFADKTASFTLRSNLSLDLPGQLAKVENLRLSINQLKMLAELEVSDFEQQPKVVGKLSVSQVNLREFLPSIGIALPAMQDSKAMSSFSLASQLRADTNTFSLDDLSIKLDETTFNGQLGSKNIGAGQLYVQLQGDQLNADAYLPPAEQAPSPKSEQTGAKEKKTASNTSVSDPIEAPLPPLPGENQWSDEPLLPVELLRTLALDIQLGLEQLQLNQLPFTAVQLAVTANQGVISLAQMEAGLFDGQLAANAKLDVRKDQPKLEFASKITEVPVHELSQALELEVPLRGLFSLEMSKQTSGNSERQLVANLSGNGRFNMSQGQIEGMNIDNYLCSAVAVLNRKSLTNKIQGENTPFTSLGGSYVVKAGVLSNQDLSIAIPGLQNSGKGKLDLNVLGLDYELGVKLLGDTRPMPDPACTINERYVGLEFPLACRGSLAPTGALSCNVNGDALGKIVARIAGDQLKDKVEKKIEQKLDGKLDEKLNQKLDKKLGDKASQDVKKSLKGLFK